MLPVAAAAPSIDYMALAPLFALGGGACVVLLAGVAGAGRGRPAVPAVLTVAALLAALGLAIPSLGDPKTIMEGALRIDDFGLTLFFVCVAGALAAVLLSDREPAASISGHGEYHSLLLMTVGGMFVLLTATNIISFFLGLELLSIPLYVLCASHVTRKTSLESGLKYLIIGSVGSATLLFGLALIYAGTGGLTSFGEIASAVSGSAKADDTLVLAGSAMIGVGLLFKASIAPFHQWTPDVYEGAPTPVTAFMSVATKAAAFGAFVRMFDVALFPMGDIWAPALGFVACVSMVVGNAGAIGQTSLKRMLAYSGIAQAGYVMAGLVAASVAGDGARGASAVVFYIFAYMMMNIAAFAVIRSREVESHLGDDITTFRGLGQTRPLHALAMTVGLLAMAGFPATVGFLGKFFLIEASVASGYLWLAIAIVVTTVVSLVYYLRVIAAMWMQSGRLVQSQGHPVVAGGSPEASTWRAKIGNPWMAFVAVAGALATIFFGIVPQPLLDLADAAGRSLFGAF